MPCQITVLRHFVLVNSAILWVSITLQSSVRFAAFWTVARCDANCRKVGYISLQWICCSTLTSFHGLGLFSNDWQRRGTMPRIREKILFRIWGAQMCGALFGRTVWTLLDPTLYNLWEMRRWFLRSTVTSTNFKLIFNIFHCIHRFNTMINYGTLLADVTVNVQSNLNLLQLQQHRFHRWTAFHQCIADELIEYRHIQNLRFYLCALWAFAVM